MTRTILRWVRRLVVVAVVGAVVVRLLDPDDRAGGHRSEAFPAIGGDTWPPVPTNLSGSTYATASADRPG